MLLKTGIGAVVLGVLLLVIQMFLVGNSGFISPSDPYGTNFESLASCNEYWDDCKMGLNFGAFINGSIFVTWIVGPVLLMLSLIAHFLILTAETIIVGLGGNTKK